MNYRRDKLMRLAQAGKLVSTGSYHYDEMSGQEIRKTTIPVRLSSGHGDFVEGQCNLHEFDFTTKTGYANLSADGKTCHLGVHSNCTFDFQMADGSSFLAVAPKTTKAHRPENARMQAFLAANGVEATPKYIPDGSLRGNWRLYNSAVQWSAELADKLNALGFKNYDGRPLDRLDGNGGVFSVFVRGHNELLSDPKPLERPAGVSGPAELVKTKHTQKGYDLFVVRLGTRVPRAEFSRLLDCAKSLRGWWSSYDKDGAIPGFQFKEENAAQSFLAGVSVRAPQESPQIKADTSKATADRLRTLAAGMDSQIEAKINSGISQQNPTARRIRIAEGMRADGERMRQTQATLKAIADHIEAGTVPPEVGAVNWSKKTVHEALHWGRDSESALSKWLKRITQEPVRDEKADKIRKLEQDLMFANIPGYFSTPPELVQRMLAFVHPQAGEIVLEPSAGSGAIACAVNHGAKVEACEVNYSLRELLGLKGVPLVGNDFMDLDSAKQYDHVIMNPPFERGQDCDHIRKAYEHLKDGGRLAAISSPGFTFRTDEKFTAFREWVAEVGGDVEEIPAGAFKKAGTGVAARLILIQK